METTALHRCFKNVNVHINHLGILLNASSDSVCLMWLRVYVSNRVSANVHNLVQGHTSNNKGLYTTLLFLAQYCGATLSVQYMDTGCMRTNRSRYVLGDYFPVFQTVSHLRKPVPKLKIKAIKIDIKSSQVLYYFKSIPVNLHLG